MSSRREGHRQRTKLKFQSEEWPEKMTVAQAHKFLGVSHALMTRLLSSQIVSYELDPLDNRVKLVKRSDLELLLQKRKQGK